MIQLRTTQPRVILITATASRMRNAAIGYMDCWNVTDGWTERRICRCKWLSRSESVRDVMLYSLKNNVRSVIEACSTSALVNFA